MAAMLRRLKPTTECKIAVVGGSNVGKTALTVRFLTKRYIGEYDHRTEKQYKHEISIDGDTFAVEIIDTRPSSTDEFDNVVEMMQRADGLLLVFSMTDRNSFNYIRRAKSALQSDVPMYLVSNKSDLVHLRKVGYDEANEFAQEIHCKFSEVSAADHIDQVAEVFHTLCREIHAHKRKSKQSLLERMLSSKRPYTRGKSDILYAIAWLTKLCFLKVRLHLEHQKTDILAFINARDRCT